MIIFHRKRAAQTPKANTSSGPITRSQSHSSSGDTDENHAGQIYEASIIYGRITPLSIGDIDE